MDPHSTRADPRQRARQLCARHASGGDALSWFEALYREARRGTALVPWADFQTNPHLCEWQEQSGYDVRGKRCLVVGCGLGDDAEYLALAGGAVVAFDIAPTAIEWCRVRFQASRVDYLAADVLAPNPEWRRRFDFVFEAYTLQVLPAALRQPVLRNLATTLAPQGTLLLVCRGRDAGDPAGDMPWPLTREEIVGQDSLELVTFEDYFDAEVPPVRRFRVAFRQPT